MDVDRSGDAPVRLRHISALDGMRGLAVALVLLFHGGVAQARGGYLGVTMFFTLSGFLITSLLLVEHAGSGRLSLRRFWARRARRLVPALLLTFPLVALVVRLAPQPPSSGLMGDAASSLLWFQNWRLVLAHSSYADLFSLPSPFQHFWSLAVEEQYYLVFPLLALFFLGRAGKRAFATLLGILIVVSVALGTAMTAHAPTITRAYYGTDSRIAEILIGALLAVAVVRDGATLTLAPRLRHVLDAAAIGALATLGWLVTTLAYGDARLFRGGLLLAALCTAVLIFAAVQPGSLVARALSLRPLAALGVISYGVYLFHWPLFLLITKDTAHADGVKLFALRIGATLALAAVSYAVVENPIRRGALRRTPALTGWAFSAVTGLAVVALAAGVISLPSLPRDRNPVGNSAAPGSSLSQPSTSAGTGKAVKGGVSTPRKKGPATAGVANRPATSPAAVSRHHKKAGVPQQLVGTPGVDYTQPPAPPTVPPGALKVVVVGDSIGNNFGRGLGFWAQDRTDVAVYNLAIPACPIARGGVRRIDPDRMFAIAAWCGWWGDPTSPRYQALVNFAPDVVFVEDGINEIFDRKLDSWSNWEKPSDTQFDQWLTSEYEAFIKTVSGAKVVIANAPCGDFADHFPTATDGPQRVQNINNLDYARIINASSANLFNEVCPNGQYSNTVDGVDDARPDGFHFTDEAATALARDWLGPLLLQAGT